MFACTLWGDVSRGLCSRAILAHVLSTSAHGSPNFPLLLWRVWEFNPVECRRFLGRHPIIDQEHQKLSFFEMYIYIELSSLNVINWQPSWIESKNTIVDYRVLYQIAKARVAMLGGLSNYEQFRLLPRMDIHLTNTFELILNKQPESDFCSYNYHEMGIPQSNSNRIILTAWNHQQDSCVGNLLLVDTLSSLVVSRISRLFNHIWNDSLIWSAWWMGWSTTNWVLKLKPRNSFLVSLTIANHYKPPLWTIHNTICRSFWLLLISYC